MTRKAWGRLLIVSGLMFGLSVSGSGQERPGREQDGLNGPVKLVTVEKAPLSQSFGAWVEGQRALAETKDYSPDGNLLVQIEYGDNGKKKATRVYGYDAAGKWIEMKVHDALDRLERKTVNEYDSGGNRTISSVYSASGALESKSAFLYDAAGNRLTTDMYNADGSLEFRMQSTCDAMGREVETYTYEADGSLFSHATNTYSSDGRLMQSALSSFQEGAVACTMLDEYDDRGNVVSRSFTWASPSSLLIPDTKTSFEYALDSHGNWVKRTESEWVRKFGTSYWESKFVTYRTISYY